MDKDCKPLECFMGSLLDRAIDILLKNDMVKQQDLDYLPKQEDCKCQKTQKLTDK
jgi:hypothetical protein